MANTSQNQMSWKVCVIVCMHWFGGGRNNFFKLLITVNLLFWLLFCYENYYLLWVCALMLTVAQVWRSEDNLWLLTLSMDSRFWQYYIRNKKSVCFYFSIDLFSSKNGFLSICVNYKCYLPLLRDSGEIFSYCKDKTELRVRDPVLSLSICHLSLLPQCASGQ